MECFPGHHRSEFDRGAEIAVEAAAKVLYKQETRIHDDELILKKKKEKEDFSPNI
jgi:hypothetical protein